MRPSHCLLLAALLGSGPAWAQELRDPTSWPVGVQAPASSPASPASGAEPAASGPRIQQIVIVDGRAYVVARGRRYGVGDPFGDARITRIEEQAVWLRDASGSRRESLYPGIEKRVPAALAAPAAKKKTTRAGTRASAQEKS